MAAARRPASTGNDRAPRSTDPAELNPFTPGFGQTPLVVAVAGTPVEDFERALREGRTGDRVVLISGARGTGKTVLLNQLAAVAEDLGWLTIPLYTSSQSFTDELRDRLVGELRSLDPSATVGRITGAGGTVGPVGVNARRDVIDRYPWSDEPWGVLLDRAAQLLTEAGRGLLLVADEIQAVSAPQLYELAQRLQHQISRGRHVAFAAAGLSKGIDALLQDDGTTFLRRARRNELHSVDVGAASEVIRETVASTSRTISPEAAVAAGEISQGYPYLIQLVGARAWDHAGTEQEIALEDVTAVRDEVIAEMGRNVHAPVLRGIVGLKRAYLRAMAEDDGPSQVSDIAQRIGVDGNNQGVHRDRLIREGVIRPAGRGYVEFAMPYLREAVIAQDEGAVAVQDPEATTARVTRVRRPRR
ncbi:AAA family ATPase [Brachybacterium sp. EF45031]|uniref:ATP-binding protein n=1 Tax=Brachybacterium sillae TaxID=2810536 RepID=UPI00217D5529|nr:ATP-binding protein [Brachybacterium sillae]MCS6710631.1 AAA family ATPase [Brachybacterium sillae]